MEKSYQYLLLRILLKYFDSNSDTGQVSASIASLLYYKLDVVIETCTYGKIMPYGFFNLNANSIDKLYFTALYYA